MKIPQAVLTQLQELTEEFDDDFCGYIQLNFFRGHFVDFNYHGTIKLPKEGDQRKA